MAQSALPGHKAPKLSIGVAMPLEDSMTSMPSSSSEFFCFTPSRIDFSGLDTDVENMTSTQKDQWFAGVCTKAREMYVHATHAGRTRAKPGLQRRPIDGDELAVGADDAGDAEDAEDAEDADNADNADNDGSSGSNGCDSILETPSEDISADVRWAGLLERTRAAMNTVTGCDDEPNGDGGWQLPQLQSFLNTCLESWEKHNALLAMHKHMTKYIRELQDQNGLLSWYASHLQGKLEEPHESFVSAPAPALSWSSPILQSAHKAALKVLVLKPADASEKPSVTDAAEESLSTESAADRLRSIVSFSTARILSSANNGNNASNANKTCQQWNSCS